MDSKDRSRVQVLGTEQILRGFFDIDVYTMRHVDRNGEWTEAYSRYLLHRPDAVCAVVYNTELNKAYFVRQFRVGTMERDSGWTVELAAGLVDAGEGTEEAMRREILEELGYQVRQLRHLNTFYASPGIISERLFLYYAEVVESDRVSDGGGVDEEHEDIEILAVSPDQIDAVFSGDAVSDAKTLLGVFYLKEILRDKAL